MFGKLSARNYEGLLSDLRRLRESKTHLLDEAAREGGRTDDAPRRGGDVLVGIL